MSRYLTDTRPEAEAVLIELLRQAPPWRKIRMMEQLNQQMRALSLAGVRARHPDADEAEIRRRVAELWLGPALATQIHNSLAEGWPLPTPENTMINEATAVTLQVVALLEELQIPYVIGGSVASTFHGVARATLDADIVAAICFEHMPILIARLQDDFYISPDALIDAITHHSAFTLIHLTTLFKVDIFIPKARTFDAAQLAHGVRGLLSVDSEQQVRFTSAEDTILVKLEWYQLGNALSDRQWQDIIGVMRVQSHRLDLNYLERTARELGIVDLLERALTEAGISSIPPNHPVDER
jgi:hypothetical protein